ncbi:MAG: hypothetical protein DWB44_15740 [Chloroflexi bacterium]|nr:MAG: hypothetical protein UZ13_02941 [Chloroflexi bacterium OLB13]MBC6957618.1 hypothetical protein [Chloroflexota bacterium]MBV6437710.1 hypothetical protein [Anaerolineae bacterium]GIK30133.1 MAG: hypothetical protein BroJett007_32710 [Chloroflexota bacterium]
MSISRQEAKRAVRRVSSVSYQRTAIEQNQIPAFYPEGGGSGGHSPGARRVRPLHFSELIWPWEKAERYFGERYIVPDAIIAAAGAVGAVGVGVGIWLLPFPLNVIAGAAAGSAAVNTAEQITQLKQEPRNERVYTSELLPQINILEAALSGVYGAGTSALAVASGGTSLIGSAIGSGIAIAESLLGGEGSVTFRALSASFWSGFTFDASTVANSVLGLDKLSLFWRLGLGSPIYAGLAESVALVQKIADTFATDGLVNLSDLWNRDALRNASLIGIANLSSVATKPGEAVVFSLLSGISAWVLSHALEQ